MSIGRFMCGIAALIYHPPTQTYLILRRAGHRDYGADTLECVTGRVDQGESFEQAVHREVREETGVQVQIEFLIGTTHFYRGDAVPENELLGLRYACTIADRAAVTMGDEHSETRWLTADDIYALTPEANWLHQTVRAAETIRAHLTPELADFYRILWV
jgi:8-oxo-dGTP diphosphatase